MRVAITGHTSGLGKELFTRFENVVGFSRSNGFDITDIEKRKDIISSINECDVFINNAHEPFFQTILLEEIFKEWKFEKKTIVNIISRSKYPNISKGFLYSTSKASLSHLSNSLRFVSDKKCRIIDINAGLLDSNMPSLTYKELCDIIIWSINQPFHIEIGEISVWNTTPYKIVSEMKDELRKY